MRLKHIFRKTLLTGMAMLAFTGAVQAQDFSESDAVNVILFMTGQPGTFSGKTPTELLEEYNEAGEALCRLELYPESKGRAFTSGEKEMARGIFGDEVNLDRARMYQQSQDISRDHPSSTCEHGNSVSVAFFGEKNYSADFSVEKDPRKSGDYNHEVTHVWQIQNGFISRCSTYIYRPVEGADFLSYCSEQQGSMIEEYSKLFLHPDHKLPNKMSTRSAKNYEILKDIVEDQFPEAKKTRLAFEARLLAAKPPQSNP